MDNFSFRFPTQKKRLPAAVAVCVECLFAKSVTTKKMFIYAYTHIHTRTHTHKHANAHAHTCWHL